MVIWALPGNPFSPKTSLRIFAKVAELFASVRKTVIVTTSFRLPPARFNVWSISANIVLVWASKLPFMSAPSRSVSVLSPANQKVVPPRVATSGE